MSKDVLEKMHTDMAEFSEDDDRPLLNSFESINPIVRKFASEVINNAFSGRMNGDQVEEWALTRSRRLGHLLFGENHPDADKYRRGVWNRPENLGTYLLLKMRISGECRKAVQFLLLNFAKEIIEIMNAAESKGEAVARREVDKAYERVVNLLLGVDSGMPGLNT